MQLPVLNINLPEWQAKDFYKLKDLIEKVRQVGASAGEGSDIFKHSLQQLKLAFARESQPHLSGVIKNNVDVRAFTSLLATDDRFAEDVLIDKVILNHLLSITSPIRKLSLMQLIRAYFKHFEHMAKGDDLSDWCYFINRQLAAQDLHNGSNELKTYAENAELLFSKLGPAKVAAKAESDKVDLDVLIHRLGLTGYADGRFLTLTRYQYYLRRLEKMPVGADDDLLTELVKPDVFNAPHENNQLLGHAILKSMIDRSSGHQLSDAWQRVILTVAGDPRVPKSSQKYQKWWAILGDKRIAMMRGWLSRFDLSLFLKVLEQSARDGNNDDMERMFLPRKAFMEGLEKSGVITESRLFLSRYAERYLKRHYQENELPHYAKVSSQDTSMIYLNLDNKVHMIEGSHSFTLKLMNKLPSKCRVSDYSTRLVSNDELRTTVSHQFRNEFKTEDGLCELRHDQHFNWQNNALTFLNKHNLKVDASAVIERESYRFFKQKFGVR